MSSEYTHYIPTHLREFIFANMSRFAAEAVAAIRKTWPALPSFDKTYLDAYNILDTACEDGYVRLVKWCMSKGVRVYTRHLMIAIKQHNYPVLHQLTTSEVITADNPHPSYDVWLTTIATGQIDVYNRLTDIKFSSINYHFGFIAGLYQLLETLANSLNPHMLSRFVTVIQEKAPLDMIFVFLMNANPVNLAQYLALTSATHQRNFTHATSITYNKNLESIRMFLGILTESATEAERIYLRDKLPRRLGSQKNPPEKDEPVLAILREFDLLDYTSYEDARNK